MKKAFTLIEVMIVTVLVVFLIAAVTQGVMIMLRSQQFTDNDFMASHRNRLIMLDVTNRLKQARNSTISLSGTPQPLTIEVSMTPTQTALVQVYPEVTFEEPVAFDYTNDRVIWSNDPDAASFCASDHKLYGHVPCVIKISRKPDTGNVIFEYVSGGAVVHAEPSHICDEYSTVADDNGDPLPGVGFFLYPLPLPNSVTMMVSTSTGQKDNKENPLVNLATTVKVIPNN
jgi:prepilin-type N-terminal cleavage/methylation domain-containing protein